MRDMTREEETLQRAQERAQAMKKTGFVLVEESTGISKELRMGRTIFPVPKGDISDYEGIPRLEGFSWADTNQPKSPKGDD